MSIEKIKNKSSADNVGDIKIGERPHGLKNLDNKNDRSGLSIRMLRDKLNGAIGKLKNISGPTNKIINNEVGSVEGANHNNSDENNVKEDNYYKKVNKGLDKKGRERRHILEVAGKAVLGTAVGVVVGKFTSDILEKEGLLHKDYGAGLSDWELGQGLEVNDKIENIESEDASNGLEEQGKNEEVTREKKEVNYRSLKKMLRDRYLTIGKINIVNIKNIIKNYWLQEYDVKGSQHLGLEKSLERMTEWHNEVQDIFSAVFKQKGLECPQWLSYLGIAESHWAVKKNQDSTSWVGAAGVFQLMPTLARDYGLRVDNSIDERYDVLKNSKVAAEYLADLYKRVVKNMNIVPGDDDDWNSDTWKLVLALYNGGYVGRFFKWANENKHSVNYNSYLQFRENRLQNFLDNKLRVKNVIYKVEKGDTLFGITKKYKGTTVQEIMLENNLNSRKIKIGQILKIKLPEKTLAQKRKILEKMFAFGGGLFSALENLNYPEKFIGILEAMKKNNLFIENDNDRVEHEYEKIEENIPWLGGLNKRRLKK